MIQTAELAQQDAEAWQKVADVAEHARTARHGPGWLANASGFPVDPPEYVRCPCGWVGTLDAYLTEHQL